MHDNSLQSCPILCDPMDYSPLGFSVLGIPQARMLEWVAILSSRGSSEPRDGTGISCISGRFFTTNAIWEAEVLCMLMKYICLLVWLKWFCLLKDLSGWVFILYLIQHFHGIQLRQQKNHHIFVIKSISQSTSS